MIFAQKERIEQEMVSVSRWAQHLLSESDWLSWANLDQGDIELVEQDLIGRRCRAYPRAGEWLIDMGDGRSLILSMPWRIISDGHIAFGSRDNGSRFGMDEPLDGKAETRLLLGGKRLSGLAINRETADLSLHFGEQTRLDGFNSSSGYEGWRIRCQLRGRWLWVIGSGGGQIRVIFLNH